MKFNRIVFLKVLLKNEELTIKNLRISFDVKKTRTREQNKSEIKVYNLSETSRAKIKDEGTTVELYAGYSYEDVGLIFKGDVREIVHKREGADIVTMLTAGDGDNALTNSTVNVTVKSGGDLKSYIKILVSKLDGIKVGKIVGLDGLKGNKTATTFTGTVRDELDRLALKYDFEYTIENHTINIVRNKSNTGLSEIISASTGMIDTPMAKEKGMVEVKTMLNNNLKCNDLFRLESEFLKRDYRIEELTFSGDTHSLEWSSFLIGASLG